MRLSAAITGNLPKFMASQVNAAKEAITEGVRKISTEIRDDLRRQAVSAGLGVPMSRTWKVSFYPKGGKSLKAVGLIYPDMAKVIRVFAEGTTIRSKHGKFLAVPSEAAPKRGIGGKRIGFARLDLGAGAYRFEIELRLARLRCGSRHGGGASDRRDYKEMREYFHSAQQFRLRQTR